MEKVEKYTVKETKELLMALNEVTIVLAKLLADGVQFSDVTEVVAMLTTNPAFVSKLKNAADNVKECGAELADASLGEMFELLQAQMEYIPKVIEAFTKKKAV